MLEEYMKQLGYTEKEIKFLLSSYSLSGLNHDTLYGKIEEKFTLFRSLGYKDKEIIKMTLFCPAICGLVNDNILKKIDDMIRLGYKREDVLYIGRKLPAIFTYNIETIKDKIADLVSLGYTSKEVLKMTRNTPSIYSCGIDNIKNKIADMKALGYSMLVILKIYVLK